MNVSIVLPAKNEEKNIGQCLEQIQPQLDPGDEVLVLDNESEDRTAEIADEFEEVEVVYTPDDSVQQTAHIRGNLDAIRQFGTERAENEIIVSTDADTLPPDDWLDRIKAHFEADDELSVVWGTATDTNGVPVRDLTAKFGTLIGGVSGCNTAFRKSDFEDLDKGYIGWPMFEDVALVTRLARAGKAVHDRDLEMRTSLLRNRYQTIPMLAVGGASVLSGSLLGGPIGAGMAGVGAGVAGTELFYEQLAEIENAVSPMPIHHDQIGLALTLVGTVVGGTAGIGSAGLGAGIIGHHVLTEGVSGLPTDLMENTDEVCRIEETEEGTTLTVCEPSRLPESKITRLLAAMTVGAVAGRVIAYTRTNT